MAIFWIAIGSAIGGVSRYWIVQWSVEKWGAHYPYGTLGINVLGSLIIGILAGWINPMGRPSQSESLQQFLMIGMMGGFTTFSAFSLQMLQLLQANRLWSAFGYAIFSVVLSLGCVALGYWLGKLTNLTTH